MFQISLTANYNENTFQISLTTKYNENTFQPDVCNFYLMPTNIMLSRHLNNASLTFNKTIKHQYQCSDWFVYKLWRHNWLLWKLHEDRKKTSSISHILECGLISISRLANRKYGSFVRQITSGFRVENCRFYWQQFWSPFSDNDWN